MMPAINNDPIISEVEVDGYQIEKGEPSDSKLYMDIKRFYDVGIYKVLGINSAGFSAIDKEELQEDYFLKSLCQKIRIEMFKDDIYIINDDVLLVSNDNEADINELNDISNGRLDIFKAYIENWNLTGHEDMNITMPNGELMVHAHNVYLQVIHDHGVITGLVFILFGILSFVLLMIRLV